MSNKQPYATLISPVPPPVPKRKFEKLIAPPSQPASPNVIDFSTINQPPPPPILPELRRNTKRSNRKNRRSPQTSAMVTTTVVDQQSSDDDLLCLAEQSPTAFGDDDESPDLPVFGDAVVIATAPSIQFPNSNRSSSDSNKSQMTNDTGYMTSSNDTDRIFFGAGTTPHYRSRFSSVDTQSSIDSFSDSQMSQQQSTRLIQSPLSAGGSRGGSAATNRRTVAMPPVVPMRKQTTVPKIPPPVATVAANRNRGIPPTPPLRTQNSLDSGGKILQNGHHQTAKNFGQEMYSKPLMKSSSKMQQHHSKLTQRQDSSISSDSYSLTSSPGYNTKSMEAPLLQYAAKINKSSGMRHHQDPSGGGGDGFGINANARLTGFNNRDLVGGGGVGAGASSMGGAAIGTFGNGGGGRGAIRQDSNVSSDSFSQTSSPGYNSKLIDAPLIAHAVKLHSSKILLMFAFRI